MGKTNRFAGIISILRTRVLKGSRTYYLFLNLLYYLKAYIPLLKKIIIRYIRSRPAKPFIIKNSVGKFLAYPNDDSFTKSSEIFELSYQDWLKRPEPKIILDIGSNIGFYSIISLSKYKYGQAYAFEANPETYRVLEKNIRLNRLENKVTAYNIGLSSSDGTLNFYKDKFHTGGSKILSKDDIKRYDESQTSKIPVKRLDDVFKENISDISFIKIDVEGHELEVLKGMDSILEKVSKGTRIFIEIWDKNSHREKTKKLLEKKDFRIIESMRNNYLFKKK